MKRVSRKMIATDVRVALAVLKPYQKTRFGLHDEAIRQEIAADLVERIMGKPESETVLLVPDMVGHRQGRWDEDEPHPAPEVPLRD